MLENLPEETTDLLIDLCTSLSPLTVEPDEAEATPIRQSAGGPSYLSYLALNRASMTGASDAASPTTVQPDTPRDTGKDSPSTASPPPGTPGTATASKPPSTVKRPSPRLYFAHFVDHTDHFVRFLETVARKRWGQTVQITNEPLPVETDPQADEQAERRDQAAVWNTLFELYLAQPGASTDANADPAANARALALLENTALPYDTTHALILCSTRAFTPGLVLLWERMGMHEDVVRFFIDRHHDGDASASAEVVRRLRMYGPAHAQLYTLVLRFLTSTPALLGKHREDVVEILRVVDEERLMPPVSVVQLLSRNDVASVGLVKEWLMARIKSAREEVDMVRSSTFPSPGGRR